MFQCRAIADHVKCFIFMLAAPRAPFLSHLDTCYVCPPVIFNLGCDTPRLQLSVLLKHAGPMIDSVREWTIELTFQCFMSAGCGPTLCGCFLVAGVDAPASKRFCWRCCC